MSVTVGVRPRELIKLVLVESIANKQPFARLTSLSGVRVHDVGQGDSISILDGEGNPVLQIDYGGRQGHPFTATETVDKRMPVAPGGLVMLSHWDEDHWSSGPRGTTARAADWLVPRQLTSPRAVRFATELEHVHCIPEECVGEVMAFEAGGDALLWEKIGHSAQTENGAREDCNRTGVAFALVRRRGEGGEVILLPGDAAFGHVRHYHQLHDAGFTLTGIVAFHHGAGTHWTRATRRLVRDWPKTGDTFFILVSCADPNSYGHPDRELYETIFPGVVLETTAEARSESKTYIDKRFAGS
jgi:hypothetical protein